MALSPMKLPRLFRRPLTLIVFAGWGATAWSAGASADFTHWPAGTSPAEVGRRVARHFVSRPFEWETNPKRTIVIYPEVCAWYGALTYAQLADSPTLTAGLIAKYDILRTAPGATKVSQRDHVDDRVFGSVPLEIYRQTHDESFLGPGRTLADAQWDAPTDDGITHEARYWIDDMYMITLLQVQVYRATHEAKYLERAALTMATYLNRLQQPNGLFFHAADSPYYWGRGNGWVAAGLAELLRELPASNPHHARILAGYHRMMTALLRAQGADGMWRQLLDHPESWPESSCTGMFTFAFVTGVKNGWLDEPTFAPAARRAWLALVGYIGDDDNIREVCVGTDKAQRVVGSDPAKQTEYYLARPRKSGDLHGQAPVLWSAAALLR
jgi:rhamnogalacturonyl hydrolase YesR